MWIRLDCDAAHHQLFDDLAEAIGVGSVQAYGHFFAMTGQLAKFGTDGALAPLSDRTLEKWALWDGEPGRWAAAVRAHCQDPETGELRGFRRRNERLLQKQRADALKRKPPRNPRKTLAGNQELPPENPRANDDDDGNENKASSSAAGARAGAIAPEAADPGGSAVSPLEYTQRCTAAANRGLRDNPAIGSRCHELVSSNQAGIAGEWQASGVPITVAEQTVYARAAAYQPSPRNPQPHRLTYFTAAVHEAWERAQLQALGADLVPVPSGSPTGKRKRVSGWERVKQEELARQAAADG